MKRNIRLTSAFIKQKRQWNYTFTRKVKRDGIYVNTGVRVRGVKVRVVFPLVWADGRPSASWARAAAARACSAGCASIWYAVRSRARLLSNILHIRCVCVCVLSRYTADTCWLQDCRWILFDRRRFVMRVYCHWTWNRYPSVYRLLRQWIIYIVKYKMYYFMIFFYIIWLEGIWVMTHSLQRLHTGKLVSFQVIKL